MRSPVILLNRKRTILHSIYSLCFCGRAVLSGRSALLNRTILLCGYIFLCGSLFLCGSIFLYQSIFKNIIFFFLCSHMLSLQPKVCISLPAFLLKVCIPLPAFLRFSGYPRKTAAAIPISMLPATEKFSSHRRPFFSEKNVKSPIAAADTAATTNGTAFP